MRGLWYLQNLCEGSGAVLGSWRFSFTAWSKSQKQQHAWQETSQFVPLSTVPVFFFIFFMCTKEERILINSKTQHVWAIIPKFVCAFKPFVSAWPGFMDA